MSKLTEQEIEDLGCEIESDGLEYWITYRSYDGADEELKRLKDEAEKAIRAVERHLDEIGVVYE